MLRNGLSAALCATMALTMWSCGSGDEPMPDEPQEPQNPPVETVKKLTLKAVISSDEGRVGAQEDAAAGRTHFFWEVGDEISLYTDTPSEAATFTVTEVTDGVATLTGELAVTDGQEIHGVYPGFATESQLLTTQKGTLEDVGDCLLMTASSTYADGQGMTLQFHHQAALMTFNLTFPSSVTEVTDLCLENAQSQFTFTSSGVKPLKSLPITIQGPLTPDSNGLLPLHVVILPESQFKDFILTCTTDQGDYRMPSMTSENIAKAGKNHRTSRTMETYSPYEMAVITPSGKTSALIEKNIQHDHGTIKWTQEVGLTAGTPISICDKGVWKCFHTLTDTDVANRSITLPDITAGCTIIDPADPQRNDWIVALCMGGHVSTTFDGDGATKPLYWATGNLVAIDRGDGTTAFRLATLAEMEKSQLKDDSNSFRYNPDLSGNLGITDGAMWDMFLYGDPTGRKATSTFTSAKTNICGGSSDIARAALGYPWRLPYVPQTLPESSTTTDRSATNELWALIKCEYSNGHLTYDNSNTLFFPFAGNYYSSEWHDVGKIGYYMTGNVKNNRVIYLEVQTTFASQSETAGVTNSSAFNVRPVTD